MASRGPVWLTGGNDGIAELQASERIGPAEPLVRMRVVGTAWFLQSLHTLLISKDQQKSHQMNGENTARQNDVNIMISCVYCFVTIRNISLRFVVELEHQVDKQFSSCLLDSSALLASYIIKHEHVITRAKPVCSSASIHLLRNALTKSPTAFIFVQSSKGDITLLLHLQVVSFDEGMHSVPINQFSCTISTLWDQ